MLKQSHSMIKAKTLNDCILGSDAREQVRLPVFRPPVPASPLRGSNWSPPPAESRARPAGIAEDAKSTVYVVRCV